MPGNSRIGSSRIDIIGQNGNTGEHYEADPNGIHQRTPGSKLDLGKPRADLVFDGFPLALLAVAEVATFGANKYTGHGWLSVPDGVKRYTAAMDRHRLAEGAGHNHDAESGLPHAAHLAWNALARLELMLQEEARLGLEETARA